MVHPADAIAFTRSVDYGAVTEIKEERMARCPVITRPVLHDVLPANAGTLVFRNEVGRTDIAIGEYTVSMYR
jgi:hypothetical protein